MRDLGNSATTQSNNSLLGYPNRSGQEGTREARYRCCWAAIRARHARRWYPGAPQIQRRNHILDSHAEYGITSAVRTGYKYARLSSAATM
jgi:hypothetical protein